jgi:UDP-N-acetylmuramyl pentapeptide phosphotransferase/UDP-N-acetylglucosamine-1-phosphate transferase
MISRTQDGTNRRENAEPKRSSPAESMLNFTAILCFVAGVVGIIKAVEMQLASDGLLCAGGSLAACALVGFLYFRNE